MDRYAIHPTFEDLAARDPRLAKLRETAEAAGGRHRRLDGGFCANAVWYGYSRNGSPYGLGGIRTELVKLVGDHSRNADPLLHSSDAYDLAYQTLWELLPPCEHDDEACGWGSSEQKS